VISHETAVQMLYGVDKGSVEFMGAKYGMGVFVAEAGPNTLALHQSANDGYRGLYVMCFKGPDRGKGFAVLCNGDNNGMVLNAMLSQTILREFRWQGIDLSRVAQNFDFSKGDIRQEEIVNLGYKHLLFSSFVPDLPEELEIKGSVDPLARFNRAIGAEVEYVTNQKFARVSNLFSERLPAFDPDAFGRQGKIMDSWETVRHNERDCDEVVARLAKPSPVSFVSVSTKFHDGNHAEFVGVQGLDGATQEWFELVPKSHLEGHAMHRFKVDSSLSGRVVSKVRVCSYPDGGLTRIGLFSLDLPSSERAKFPGFEKHTEPMRKVVKFNPDDFQKPDLLAVKKHWSSLKIGEEVDVASVSAGGSIKFVTNQHYGPVGSVIFPSKPKGMFDGLETSRSRQPWHMDSVVIQLGLPAVIHRVLVDFTFFVNNNPKFLSILGFGEGRWHQLVDVTFVKCYAGNRAEFSVSCPAVLEYVKVFCYPDGGFNRINFFSFFSPQMKLLADRKFVVPVAKL